MKTTHKYISYRADRDVYQVTVHVVDEEGQRRTVTAQANTLEEAISARNDILFTKGISVGLLSPIAKAKAVQERISPDATVKSIVKAWYKDCVDGKVTEGTKENKLMILQNYVLTSFGDKALKSITRDMVQSWIDGIQKSGGVSGTILYDKTVKQIFSCLNMLMQYCVEEGLLSVNPCLRVRISNKKPQGHRRAMTDKEMKSIMAYAKRDHYAMYLIFRLLFETDSRRGEILALKWKDIDLSEKTIQIRNCIIRLYRKAVFQEHNKNRVEKILPLADKTVFLLRLHRIRQESKGRFSEEGFVFQNEKGTYYNPSTVSAYFRKIREELGLPEDICLHSLRHTATTKLIRSGMDIAHVQRIGGWKKSSTLLDVYTHLTMDDIKDGMNSALFTD